MYDFWLGGKDNGPADRAAADAVLKAAPEVRRLAVANRRFLIGVVRELVERGVDQFIDIGTGYPTSPNVHEVARGVRPHARVVYVDNDATVVAHNRALREVPSEVAGIYGDVRRPGQILADPVVRELIDFTRPVAVLMLAVLHFVPDGDDPYAIASVLHAGVPPGSYLAISHVSADGSGRARADEAAAVYADRQATAPAVVRNPEQIQRLFAEWKLEKPGLTTVDAWPAPAPTPDHKVTGLAGLARRV